MVSTALGRMTWNYYFLDKQNFQILWLIKIPCLHDVLGQGIQFN